MSFPSSPDHNLVLLLLRHRRLLTFFELLAFLDFFFCLLFGLFMFFCCFVFGCCFFFVFLHVTSFGSVFREGFREGGREAIREVWVNESMWTTTSCIRMKNNKKKRLRFLWIKNVPFFLFEKKQQPVAKWFPYSVFFFCFFFFSSLLLLLLCQFLFLPSSFKVNLKVHNRNWRVFLLLVPMERRKKKHTKNTHKKSHKSAGQKQSASVSLRNKTTSKQFWIKTVWSILDSLRAL